MNKLNLLLKIKRTNKLQWKNYVKQLKRYFSKNANYPKERYGKPTDIKKEFKTFYKEVG